MSTNSQSAIERYEYSVKQGRAIRITCTAAGEYGVGHDEGVAIMSLEPNDDNPESDVLLVPCCDVSPEEIEPVAEGKVPLTVCAEDEEGPVFVVRPELEGVEEALTHAGFGILPDDDGDVMEGESD